MTDFANNILKKSSDKTITKVVPKKQAVSVALQNLINANDTDKDILRSATDTNDADVGDLEEITHVIDMFLDTRKSAPKKFKIILIDTELAHVVPVA